MKSRIDFTKANFKERAPLGYLIHEVSKLMKRRFEDHAREYGITLPQWRALAQIALDEGISQTALAACIDADPMTVSGILDRLEKRGLVVRYADPSDSRAKLAKLTDDGRTLFDTARNVGASMYGEALEGVSTEDLNTAQTVLKRMRENLAGQVAELEGMSK